jgi:Protein of unknown function (DUF4231)
MDQEEPRVGTEQDGWPALGEAASGQTPHGGPTLIGGEPQAHAKRRKHHAPALIARFPRFFWHPSEDSRWPTDWSLVRPEQLDEYPALAKDLRIWLEDLEPRFRRLDHRAQILQNRFWRQHVALIVGGLVATTLGAVQAAEGGGIVGLAAAQAVLLGLLAGLTVLIRSRRAQEGYLNARLGAERIKSEFFLFLAGAGDYATDERLVRLEDQVMDIADAEASYD